MFEAAPRNLNEGFLTTYSTDDLVGRVRAGRSLELVLDPNAWRARANETEAIVAYLERLPSVDWKKVDAGWGIYLTRCVACHGVFGQPPAKLPPGVRAPGDLSAPAFQDSLSDKQLVEAVRHGRRHMPALTPRVPVQDGPPLAAFVHLLSPGFESYTRYCSNCHGDDGLGIDQPGAGIQAPTVRLDRAYFSQHDPEQVRKSVWHMLGEHKPAMPHFRWTLNEAQVRAIIEYLKRTR